MYINVNSVVKLQGYFFGAYRRTKKIPLQLHNGVMVRSPWNDKKVSRRAGHNSVGLPTADGDSRVTPRRPSFQGMETNESPQVGSAKNSARGRCTWCKQPDQPIFF